MTCDEFSREFDILYNNITSNQAPSLNSYEKSVFLTQAQEQLVLSLYRGDSKKSFDLTEEIASYLSPIINEYSIKVIDNSDEETDDSDEVTDNLELVNNDYKVTTISALDIDNYWFIAYESALVSFEDKCNSTKLCDVIPTTYDAFARDSKNPFKKPNKRRVLRLNIGEPINGRNIKLIHSKDSSINEYHCTYLRHPNPIILEDLDVNYSGYNLKINKKFEQSECELNSAIHRTILVAAVELAKAVWTSTIINSNDNN